MAKELDIGEVALLSGIAPSALRHYEKKGLIASIGRNGLRRQYAAGVLDQLKLIALGRLAGFTLDEIASLFDERGRIALDRRLLAARIEELDHTLRRLGQVRAGLQHMVDCPEPEHLQCPQFRKLLQQGEF
ncbi:MULTISPECIES: helix-turn-helix domain-containing protein [Serratia]|uniref:Copper export regulator n=1 Tax=Serratia marcescens TaxID=615 RepID=A0A379ZQP0_SERMA|nr:MULTISPECIES: helix-turn-helix domain-containing protein [Serratia]KFL01901.1 merR regulatory family protein [Serratia marcescens]MCC3248641.1 helix-turn-helix domain-containing protein [Serratia marcescens]MCM2650811.1 helix-turn-helix domain-containing protein [Serratia marcescens]PNU46500.1 MerR family DNA-binding transcriptional regulator [Serratia marcescens subsp. marcescens ATCC 13880]QDL85753.1 MerR family transcriptional regulator [Serratia marcescens subsp. marcescens ATCC 13880]